MWYHWCLSGHWPSGKSESGIWRSRVVGDQCGSLSWQSPKKRGRRKSTSRSRSRSRGRSASKSRKSAGRKKATPVKQETPLRRSSRSRSRGRQQTTVESTTRKVEEFSDDEGRSKTVITETVTKSNATSAPRKTKWSNPLESCYRYLTSSDYPVMIIFVCITLITISFLLEPYVNLDKACASLSQTASSLQKYIQGLWTNSTGK